MYAAADFEHLRWTFRKGDEVADDHPMVKLRPDLFTNTPPAKGKTPKPPKE